MAQGRIMAQVATNTINATAIRRIFGQIMARAKYGGEEFVVERDGEPYVAILGVDRYEALLDQIEDLEDVRDMIEAQQEERVPFGQYLKERLRG